MQKKNTIHLQTAKCEVNDCQSVRLSAPVANTFSDKAKFWSTQNSLMEIDKSK